MVVNMLLFCAVVATVFAYLRRWSKHPLPPGPPKLPIIGNLLVMPKGFEWLTFSKWGKKYNSDIIHAQAAGMNLIVLNSVEAASDLLEKRWKLYSDRPRFPMAAELMGWEWQFSSMSYGEAFKARRRLFQEHFPPSKHEVHRPRISQFVQTLMCQLYETPEKFLDHTRHTLGGIILSLAYGINIKLSDDPYVKLAEEAIRLLAIAAVPGTFLVDVVPALKYIPEWFPGAGFKRKAKEWKILTLAFRDKPFEEGESRIRKGLAKPSFLSLSLDSLDPSKDATYQRGLIKDVAGMFFSAGSDTTVSAIHSFILLMLRYPEVQRKAQRELDSILNNSRLPTFQDEESLPYLSAVLKEVLRCQPPAPLGIPHSLSHDDVYRGYHIPAKSFVIANIWAMMNNDKDYPNPSEFNPERFLKDGQLNLSIRDPASLVFGFGRRTCPGAHIAWSALWLSAASILAAFDISNAIDEQGNIIRPTMEYHTALVYCPLPYLCRITPRSVASCDILATLVSETG